MEKATDSGAQVIAVTIFPHRVKAIPSDVA